MISILALGGVTTVALWASLGDAPWQGESSTAAIATALPTNSPRPEPTQYRQRLTGAEAESDAKNFLIREFSALDVVTPEMLGNVFSAPCEARDFNQRDLHWIVVCTMASGAALTVAVDDRTGDAEYR